MKNLDRINLFVDLVGIIGVAFCVHSQMWGLATLNIIALWWRHQE